MVENKRNLAVLVGNGLSTAFDPNLSLQKITSEMLSRLVDSEGNQAVAAMHKLAQRALPRGVTSDDDFEKFIGAFGAEIKTLNLLRDISELMHTSDKELLDSISKTADFANEVNNLGVCHVLQIIAEQTKATWKKRANIQNLINAITGAFDGRITFANLNYDTLLLATLMDCFASNLPELADMAHGNIHENFNVNGMEISALGLRKDSDFPPKARVILSHLHGSLTWWQQSDVSGKIGKEFLENGEFWDDVRTTDGDMRPLVILGNQTNKTEQVSEWPFSLAYEVFERSLKESDHWLIIGYSFRDVPINNLLSSEFAAKTNKPEVMVVTYGDKPTREEILAAFDVTGASPWLTINRSGANGFESTGDWKTFIR